MLLRVDLDGVLADFAAGVIRIFPEFVEGATEKNKKMDAKMWAAISRYQQAGGEFWYDLPLMKDALILWNYVKQFEGTEILTACGQPQFNAGPQKLKWVSKYFGPEIKVNLTQRAVEKAQYARPDAILIDDKRKALDPWIAAGGIGVLHTSAAQTISELKTILTPAG